MRRKSKPVSLEDAAFHHQQQHGRRPSGASSIDDKSSNMFSWRSSTSTTPSVMSPAAQNQPVSPKFPSEVAESPTWAKSHNFSDKILSSIWKWLNRARSKAAQRSEQPTRTLLHLEDEPYTQEVAPSIAAWVTSPRNAKIKDVELANSLSPTNKAAMMVASTSQTTGSILNSPVSSLTATTATLSAILTNSLSYMSPSSKKGRPSLQKDEKQPSDKPKKQKSSLDDHHSGTSSSSSSHAPILSFSRSLEQIGRDSPVIHSLAMAASLEARGANFQSSPRVSTQRVSLPLKVVSSVTNDDVALSDPSVPESTKGNWLSINTGVGSADTAPVPNSLYSPWTPRRLLESDASRHAQQRSYSSGELGGKKLGAVTDTSTRQLSVPIVSIRKGQSALAYSSSADFDSTRTEEEIEHPTSSQRRLPPQPLHLPPHQHSDAEESPTRRLARLTENREEILSPLYIVPPNREQLQQPILSRSYWQQTHHHQQYLAAKRAQQRQLHHPRPSAIDVSKQMQQQQEMILLQQHQQQLYRSQTGDSEYETMFLELALHGHNSDHRDEHRSVLNVYESNSTSMNPPRTRPIQLPPPDLGENSPPATAAVQITPIRRYNRTYESVTETPAQIRRKKLAQEAQQLLEEHLKLGRKYSSAANTTAEAISAVTAISSAPRPSYPSIKYEGRSFSLPGSPVVSSNSFIVKSWSNNNNNGSNNSSPATSSETMLSPPVMLSARFQPVSPVAKAVIPVLFTKLPATASPQQENKQSTLGNVSAVGFSVGVMPSPPQASPSSLKSTPRIRALKTART